MRSAAGQVSGGRGVPQIFFEFFWSKKNFEKKNFDQNFFFDRTPQNMGFGVFRQNGPLLGVGYPKFLGPKIIFSLHTTFRAFLAKTIFLVENVKNRQGVLSILKFLTKKPQKPLFWGVRPKKNFGRKLPLRAPYNVGMSNPGAQKVYGSVPTFTQMPPQTMSRC